MGRGHSPSLEGGGTAPPQTPTLSGEGDTPPHNLSPRRLRRLDSRAFGARPVPPLPN